MPREKRVAMVAGNSVKIFFTLNNLNITLIFDHPPLQAKILAYIIIHIY